MQKLGSLIRAARVNRKSKMLVMELARKVGVSSVYITQIEKHNKLPSIEVLKQIAKVLNLKDAEKCYYRNRAEQIYEQQPGLEFLFKDETAWKLSKDFIRSPEEEQIGSEYYEFINGESISNHRKFIGYLIQTYKPSEKNNLQLINSLVKNISETKKSMSNVKYTFEKNLKQFLLLLRPLK